ASSRQALVEAVLAIAAIVISVAAGRWIRAPDWRRTAAAASPWLVFAAVILIVVRQTMEVASLLQIATLQLRSFEATGAIVSGVALGTLLCVACWVAARRAPVKMLRPLLWTCWTVFLAQGLVYAFHELSEARLLPWSEALHTATEPYGPDGLYGVHF